MSEDIEALVVELLKGDGNGCRHSNDVMHRAAEALRWALDELEESEEFADTFNRAREAAEQQRSEFKAERDRLRRAIEDALAWLTDERLNDHQHIEGARVNLTAALEGVEHAD